MVLRGIPTRQVSYFQDARGLFRIQRFLFTLLGLFVHDAFLNGWVVFHIGNSRYNFIRIRVSCTQFVVCQADNAVERHLDRIMRVSVIARGLGHVPIFYECEHAYGAGMQYVQRTIVGGPYDACSALNGIFPFLVLDRTSFLFGSMLSTIYFINRRRGIFPRQRELNQFFGFLRNNRCGSIYYAPNRRDLRIFTTFNLCKRLTRRVLALNGLDVRLIIRVITIYGCRSNELKRFALRRIDMRRRKGQFSTTLHVPRRTGLAIVLCDGFHALGDFLCYGVLVVPNGGFYNSYFIFQRTSGVLSGVWGTLFLRSTFRGDVVVNGIHAFVIAVLNLPLRMAIFFTYRHSNL